MSELFYCSLFFLDGSFSFIHQFNHLLRVPPFVRTEMLAKDGAPGKQIDEKWLPPSRVVEFRKLLFQDQNRVDKIQKQICDSHDSFISWITFADIRTRVEVSV